MLSGKKSVKCQQRDIGKSENVLISAKKNPNKMQNLEKYVLHQKQSLVEISIVNTPKNKSRT